MNTPNYSLKAVEEFQSRFQKEPQVYRSPGRINLIGEHIDYNNGWVMPAGIDKETTFCFLENGTDTFRIYSINQQEQVSFTLKNYRSITTSWAKFIIGVIDEFLKKGAKIPAFDGVLEGNVPFGSGLSSSASLECAVAYGLNDQFNLGFSRVELAQLAQAAENNYVGVNCGIMDQFASVFSKENHVFKLDCDTLTFEYFPCDLGQYTLVLANSLVHHSLADSEYNTRRMECESALQKLGNGKKINFRDLNKADLEEYRKHLTPIEFNRIQFVLEEIDRVQEAAKALQNQDFEHLGQLLYGSHNGLQHLYEVSCPELDFMVDFARGYEGILGSRMMGGGFGGCTINLIEESQSEKFMDQLSKAYQTQFGIKPEFYPVKIGEGSSKVELESL